MNATFRIVKLKKYANVGNKIGLSLDEYLRRKTEAELDIYGQPGGSYYLPVFEITFDNGVKVTFENSYNGETTEERDPSGLSLMMADGDSLNFFKPNLIPLDSSISVSREINPQCINADFASYMRRAESGDETVLNSLGSTAAYAAHMRDCEVYVLKKEIL